MIRKKINKGHPQFGKISMRKDEMKKYFPNLDKILNIFLGDQKHL